MERTKHLSMTEEEKIRQNHADAERKIRGLVRKYLDHVMDIRQMGLAYETFKTRHDLSDDRLLVEEAVANMDFSKDNRGLIALITEICHLDVTGLNAILEDYENRLESENNSLKREILRRLAENHEIQGPAVLPSPDSDPSWIKAVAGLRAEFQLKLGKWARNPG